MKYVTPRVSEYVFPAILAVVFLAVGTLPYVYGYMYEPPGMRFMGIVGRGPLHSNGYLAFARQAQDGYQLFTNTLTPEPLPRWYFNPEWWLYGKAARWTGLSLAAVWHLHRAAAVILFLFGAYFLAAQCLDTVFQRRVAVALMVFGSGFGWLLWGASWLADHMHLAAGFASRMPRDIDGVGIPGYLINKPHFILAGAFVMLTYACLLVGERHGRRRYFLLAGACGTVTALLRGFALPEMCLIFALFPFFLNARERRWNWTRILNYFAAGLILGLAAADYLFLKLFNVLGISGWEIRAGTFFDYIIWYGLPLVLASLSIRGPGHFRTMRPASLLLVLWLGIAFLIAQMYPYVKYGEEWAFCAFTIVPSILAVGGPLRSMYRFLTRMSARFSQRNVKCAAAVLLVLFCAPSSAIVYARMFTTLQQPVYYYYLEDDVLAGFQWLADNTDDADVVLASEATCAFIPRFTGNKVFTGHMLLTTNYHEKNSLAMSFFNYRGNDAAKRDLVSKYGVKYVLVSPRERRPNGLNPGEHSWLTQVYSNPQVRIYRVETAAKR